ncbi:MAG TPA: hypothetical protein VEZ12_17690, partial [Herpetosiphonaceae bacterium]|nr:hypothetical protein [Herpetosiphonaceae bacterium]
VRIDNHWHHSTPKLCKQMLRANISLDYREDVSRIGRNHHLEGERAKEDYAKGNYANTPFTRLSHKTRHYVC